MARWLAALLFIAALGCRKEEKQVPYVDIQIPETVQPGTGANAFGAYANLAERAEERATLSLDARDTPGNRRKAIAEMAPLFPELASATQTPCVFLFDPAGPFAERPHTTGWLHISRALVWQIEDAVEKGEWDSAVHFTVVASKFGADLCGGAVSESTLGLGLMDGSRKALAPHVANLTSTQLSALADGLRSALSRMPDPTTTLDNEHAAMVFAVSELQDAHKEGDIDRIAEGLHGDSEQAVRSFEKLEGIARNAFVEQLLDEALAVSTQLKERANAPGATRGPVQWSLSGDALEIARQFFSAGEPWLKVRDLTLARTRLFYLTAVIRSMDAVATDLSQFGVETSTDPYTGMQLGFLALGRDSVVYSYGEDGKDDRGDTDSSRMRPDLLLEN